MYMFSFCMYVYIYKQIAVSGVYWKEISVAVHLNDFWHTTKEVHDQNVQNGSNAT
jgi:hypothetical protein